MYKTTFWTGPTIVTQMAEKFREAGINVTCVGTERLHVEVDAPDQVGAIILVQDALKAKHGTTFGMGSR